MKNKNMDGTAQALACLAQNYEVIFNVDFETGECENIHFRQGFEEKLTRYDPDPDRKSYSERMGIMATMVVQPGDLKQFLENTTAQHVIRELESKDSYLVNFRVMTGTSLIYYQIKYVRNVFLGRSNVIVGIRNCTEEFKNDVSATIVKNTTAPAAIPRPVRPAVNPPKDDSGKLTTNKTINSFIYSMSHGVRTPLNAVMGYAAMIDRYIDDPEKVHDCVRKIKVSGRTMLNIISDVIDMSSLERGSVTVEEVPGDLVARARATGSSAKEQAEVKGIKYSDDFRNITHPLVCADFRCLHQVIGNLIDNAIKYTNSGGKVNYSIEELPCDREDYGLYQITVSDTGVGMSEDLVKHVFNSFEYEKSDKLSVVQGTGVGMAITKKLVDLMGGNIEVSSQLGVGTKVSVLFSFKLHREEDDIAEARNNKVLYGRRILLAEDNALNREVAREILDSEHILVEEATDGAVAVDMVYNSEPGYYDAVLMDVQMPYMDGYTATKEIRAFENKQLAEIPIFALTANAFEEDRKRAMECGMNEHLDKPVNVDKLLSVLKKYIR